MWDDDNGNILGIGHADDLIDNIQNNVPKMPAQKDSQSATAMTITVRRPTHVLHETQGIVNKREWL